MTEIEKRYKTPTEKVQVARKVLSPYIKAEPLESFLKRLWDLENTQSNLIIREDYSGNLEVIYFEEETDSEFDYRVKLTDTHRQDFIEYLKRKKVDYDNDLNMLIEKLTEIETFN